MIGFGNSIQKVPPRMHPLPGMAAWFRWGVGITSSGGAVSQWNDQSGNARHLIQATGTNQPALQADNSILFDGADNFLQCVAFTLNQPTTIYLLAKQVTSLGNDRFCDGNAANSGSVRQGTSPNITLHAGIVAATNGNLALDTWGVISAIFNGASSELQVNRTTAATGDAGAGNMGGLTLGASGGEALFGNVQIKELILYASAHSAAQKLQCLTYLAALGAVVI